MTVFPQTLFPAFFDFFPTFIFALSIEKINPSPIQVLARCSVGLVGLSLDKPSDEPGPVLLEPEPDDQVFAEPDQLSPAEPDAPTLDPDGYKPLDLVVFSYETGHVPAPVLLEPEPDDQVLPEPDQLEPNTPSALYPDGHMPSDHSNDLFLDDFLIYMEDNNPAPIHAASVPAVAAPSRKKQKIEVVPFNVQLDGDVLVSREEIEFFPGKMMLASRGHEYFHHRGYLSKTHYPGYVRERWICKCSKPNQGDLLVNGGICVGDIISFRPVLPVGVVEDFINVSHWTCFDPTCAAQFILRTPHDLLNCSAFHTSKAKAIAKNNRTLAVKYIHDHMHDRRCYFTVALPLQGGPVNHQHHYLLQLISCLTLQ